MQWSSIKRLFWPALTLLILLVPGWRVLDEYGSQAQEISKRVIFWFLGSAIGFAIAWLVVRLIDVLVWGLIERRFQTPVPRLLKDMATGLVFLVAGIIVLALVFERDVTAFWVSSGVLGLVLGFALRNTIADIFSGIALNVDRPFRIGDWIEVHERSIQPMRGCVTEISWRSTRIRKLDNTMLILPNSLISSIILVNLSQPESRSRFELTFCLEFGIPTERALRVLTAGAKSAKGVLPEPPPKVSVNRVTETGVEYLVRYWLEPAKVSPRKGRHRVTSSILEHVYHAGISLAYPKQDLYLARMPARHLDRERDRREILGRVELFNALKPEELQELSAQAVERHFLAGEAIVRQSDPGNSMFVLVEGLLDVCKNGGQEDRQIKVVELQPGDFFGEMSLLTGAPRAATVLAVTDSIAYEIGYEPVNTLLLQRAELAWHLADVAAKRQQELLAASVEPTAPAPPTQKTLASQIVERMKGFFGGLKERLSWPA
jgi:small-conductance mechanosensitive channel/CRP-like cAMP-binding protein